MSTYTLFLCSENLPSRVIAKGGATTGKSNRKISLQKVSPGRNVDYCLKTASETAKKKCPVNDRFREGFETGMKEIAASLGGKGVVKRSGLHPVCHKKDGTSMAHLHSGLSAPSVTGRLQNPVRYKSVPYCFPG